MLGLELWKQPLKYLGRLCERTYTWVKSFLEDWFLNFLFPSCSDEETEDVQNFLDDQETPEEIEDDFPFTRSEDERRELFESYFAPQSGIVEIMEDEKEPKTLDSLEKPKIQENQLILIGCRCGLSTPHVTMYHPLCHYPMLYESDPWDYLCTRSINGSSSQWETQTIVKHVESNPRKYIKCNSLTHSYPLIPCSNDCEGGFMVNPAWVDHEVAFAQTIEEDKNVEEIVASKPTYKNKGKQRAIESTEFPELGIIHTCDCLMFKEATADVKETKMVEKVFFLDKMLRGTIIPIVLENGELAYLPKRSENGREFILHRVHHKATTCRTDIWAVGEIDDCHKTQKSGLFAGHNYKQLALLKTVPGQILASKKIRPATLPGFNDDLEEIDREICDCLDDNAQKKLILSSVREARDYIPLRERMKKDIHPQSDEWIRSSRFEVRAIELEFLQAFDTNRTATLGDWHTAVQAVYQKLSEPYPSSSNTRTVYIRDTAMPQAVKKRIKTCEGMMKGVASTHKVYRKPDKAFLGCETHQEWREMMLQRYEAAEIMSQTDIVKSCSQDAKVWLKRGAGQHLLNRVVREYDTNRALAIKTMDQFNKIFISYGGKRLDFPFSRIKELRENLRRSDELQEKQRKAAKEQKQKGYV